MVRCENCDRMIDTDYNVEEIAVWEPKILCVNCAHEEDDDVD